MDAQPLPRFPSLRCSRCGVLAGALCGVGFDVHQKCRRIGERHVAIVNARGEIEWDFECRHNSYDIALSENGRPLLDAGPTKASAVGQAERVLVRLQELCETVN